MNYIRAAFHSYVTLAPLFRPFDYAFSYAITRVICRRQSGRPLRGRQRWRAQLQLARWRGAARGAHARRAAARHGGFERYAGARAVT